MLLREFLLQDMTNFLESMVPTQKKLNTAEQIDIEQTLSEDITQQKEHSATPGFVAAKEFEAVAPKIAVDKIEIQAPIQDSNVFSSPDKGLSTSNAVDDSSSLRKVIREELSALNSPDKSSPSQLRNAIKDELRSIIKGGGIQKISQDETLRGIIHDELEKSGAIDKEKKFTPEKIHIDESLLGFDPKDDDVKVVEILEKSPGKRTKRDELSLLGKLEDWLVELKMLLRESRDKEAISKYRRLKKEAYGLRYFLEEKRFLLQELRLIGTGLFPKSEPPKKKVIIKESTQEVMDPMEFPKKSLDHKAVYHIALDDDGRKEVLDPSLRGVVVQRHMYCSESPASRKEKKSHLVSPTKSWISNTDARLHKSTFYVTKEDKQYARSPVYHHVVPIQQSNFVMQKQKVSPVVLKQCMQEDGKVMNEITKKVYVPKKEKKDDLVPWQKIKVTRPEHVKEYKRALRALRSKDKHIAVDLLTDLHEKYPKNMAIKIRLNDALKL